MAQLHSASVAHQAPKQIKLFKMKSTILVALALVAVALALPVEDAAIAIVRSDFQQSPEGSYNFGYENSDGSNRQEVGEVKEALDDENKPHKVVVVRGSFSYPRPDGTQEEIKYFADETGFHPEGSSIPKNERR